MAKNKQKFELDDDDFGFGADLDIPDFGVDAIDIKDDRKAITKVAAGARDGFKDSMTSPSMIRKLVKKSLPEGYGQAIDLADNTAGTIKNLYNDAAKEIKPVVKDLKRVTQRMMPSVEGVIPTKMAEKLKKWAASDPDKSGSFGMSAEQMREASLQSQLGDIFKFQTEQSAQDKAENEARETVRDSIEHDRHRDMLGQLDAMRVSLQQLTGYQEKVDAGYKRKSLELQFRSYFVAVDQLEEQKKFNVEAKTALDGIMKNTGLPEFVKIKDSERMKEIMRNKFLEGINDSVFGKRRGMIANVGKRLSGQFKEKLGGFLDDVRGGMDATEMVADMLESAKENPGMGPSGEELGGSIVGSMAADSVGTKIGKWLRKGIGKVDKTGKVAKVGNKLQYGVENAPQLMVDYANSDKHETGGMFDGLVRAFKEAILGSNTTNNSVQVDNIRSMSEPMPFNRQAHKSLTEIIPGYLARIYRELQVTRTGDDSIDLTTYDFSSNKFTGKAELKKKIMDKVVDKWAQGSAKDSVNDVLNMLDPEGDQLTPEQRKILGTFLAKENMANRSSSFKRLSNYEAFTGQAGRHADDFAKLFGDFAKGDADNSRQRDFSRIFNRMGTSIQDSRVDIQDQVNLGNIELLQELGLIRPGTTAINEDYINDLHFGDKDVPDPTAVKSAKVDVRRISRKRGGAPKVSSAPKAPKASELLGPTTNTPAAQMPLPEPAHEVDLDFKPLIAEVKNSAKSLETTIKGESVKFYGKTISETLLRIEAQLKEGIGFGQGDGNGPGAKKRWHENTLGEMGRGFWGMGRRGFDATRGFVNKQTDRAFGLGKRTWGGAKDLYNDLKQKSDVFIKGEVEPRLMGAKLRAGKYKDAVTGKVITSYKDIKNAVIDSETGEFVLKKEDLQNLVGQSRLAKGLVSLKNFGVGQVNKWVPKILNGYQAGFDFAKDMVKKAWGLTDLPEDVYVKGKKDPVLLARVMKAGGYRNAIDKSPVKKPSDIKGAVIDENGDVQLSTEEFKDGILNKRGKPIKSGLSKLTGMAGDLLGKGLALGKDMFDKGVNFFKGMKKPNMSGIGDWFKNFFSGHIQFGGGGSNTLLMQIRNLLNTRLPGKQTKFNDKDLTKSMTKDAVASVRSTVGNLAKSAKDKYNEASPELIMQAKTMYENLKDRGLNKVEIAKVMGPEMLALVKNKGTNLLERMGQSAKNLKARAGAFFGSFAKKDGLEVEGMGTLAKMMAEVRDRLPKPKKHVVGDVDGDGVRKNSWQDMLRRKKDKDADGKAKDKDEKGEGGILAKLGGLKGLLSKFGRKKDDDDEGQKKGGIVDTAEDMAKDVVEDKIEGKLGRRAGRAGKVAGKAGKLGRLGKMGRFLKPGMLMKGAGLAGAAYGGYSAYQNLKEGNYGSAAVDAGMSALSLGASTAGIGATASAVASGGAALAGGISTVFGGLAAGVGALISAPVLLGAAAVAALGVGAYYGYKYLTRKKLDTWSKIRYAQYGFLPTDTDHVQKVLGLEDEMKKAVKFNQGVATMEEKKIDFKKIVKDQFDIDLKDEGAKQQWLKWFLGRFKQVYLVHMSALNKVAPQKGLDDIDSLKPDEKKQYLDIAKYPDGPYNASTSPFKDLKSLPADASVVKNLVDAAQTEIDKASKEGDKSKDGSGMAKTAATAAGMAAATTTTPGMPSTPSGPKVSNEALAQVASQNKTDTGLGDSRGIVSAMGVPLAANKFATGKIDALTTVRYKTYGLVDLVLDKVRAIDALEDYINKDLKFGKGNVAKWDGSAEKAIIAMGPSFGVQAGSNNDATNWLVWFTQRFLPTYMNYLTAIAVATDKTDPKMAYTMLKPQQMVDVAMVVYTTKSSYSGSTMSVWDISPSPWPNYELNKDVKSTEQNVNGLKESAKRTVLDETKGTTPKGQDAQGNPAKPQSFLGKVGAGIVGGLKDMWQGAKDSVTGMFGGPSAPNTNGGRDIMQPGNGTGGDINSIPKPTGNKTWAALKDTIMAVAKMVGVDPHLMATFANIESGFDYTVKAGTSTAAGLYQFVNDTWHGMLKKFGSKYGIDPGTSQLDPRANALMGAEYMKISVDTLQKALNRPITDTDVYLAHFLGPAGAVKFLKANPNAIAAEVMPDAARSNKSIFYDKSGRPRTIAEVYEEVNRRVQSKSKGLDGSDGSEGIKTESTNGKPANVPAATATGGTGPTSGSAPSASVASGGGPMGSQPKNALGVPVSDAAPGATPSSSSGAKAAPASTSQQAAPQAQPVPGDVAAFGGFASPKARDAIVQSQYQRDAKDELLGNIDDNGRKQLAIQTEIRDSLKDLLALARGKATAKPEAPQAPQAPAQRPMQAAPKPPVSMDKPVW